MQQALKDVQKELKQYTGVSAEPCDGGLASHEGDRITNLKVEVPCEGGKKFSFTLVEDTAVGMNMSCKASNSHEGGLDEQLILDIAACYELIPILNKES